MLQLRPRWQEAAETARCPWEVLLLAVVAAATFFLPLAALPLRGEESRRGQAAREMVETGNWLYPQQQRQPFLTKPPIFYWSIALSAEAGGGFDRWTIRLPSALAITLVMFLLYVYGRCLLSRLGGCCAALSFASMAATLEDGMTAEIEAVFILFIAGSLLIWHLGYQRGWGPGLTWSIGYGLAAFGMLTKGLQAPCYFVAATVVYLAWRRDWRYLFHWSHGLGILLFGALLACWLVPYAQAVGLPLALATFVSESKARMLQTHGFLAHLAGYPLQVYVHLLPWSLLLLCFALPACRRQLGRYRPATAFAVVCVAVAFPTCWLPTGAEPRYFRPLFPCLAVLIAVVLQRITECEPASVLARCWQRTLACCAGFLALTGAGLALLAWLDPPWAHLRALPAWRVAAFLLATLVSAGLLLQLRRRLGPWPVGLSVVLMAGFISLCNAALVVPLRASLLADLAPPVQAVHARLPTGHRLVSLDQLHHRFTFFYPEPIPMRDLSEESPNQLARTWFCFNHWKGNQPPVLPFDWEVVEVVSTDRNRKHPSAATQTVVIGRPVLPITAAGP